MVSANTPSSYYLKVVTVDSSNTIESLSSGSQELFFTPYGKFKNFEAKVKVVAKKSETDENIPISKVIIHLNSINSHIAL